MKGRKKQLNFTVRPRAAQTPLPAEQWVREGEGTAKEPEKRLTLNLPAALHAAFKSHCAIHNETIQDKVRALIEQELAQAARPAAPPPDDQG